MYIMMIFTLMLSRHLQTACGGIGVLARVGAGAGTIGTAALMVIMAVIMTAGMVGVLPIITDGMEDHIMIIMHGVAQAGEEEAGEVAAMTVLPAIEVIITLPMNAIPDAEVSVEMI